MLCSLHHHDPKDERFILSFRESAAQRAGNRDSIVKDVHQATIPKTEDSRDSILSFRESVRGSM
jgi:hypothetical protein